MADGSNEYRSLNVSAEQIDSAVSWVEVNKVNIIKKIETLDAEVLQLSEDVLLIKGLDLQHMQNDVDDLKSNLSTLDAEVLELTEDVLLIKGLDLQHMKNDIEELQTNTYTKTETDARITEKVSEIVAGAPEDFNTLKEMSDWLTEHEDSAATMNSAIQKNASDIETANTNISKNTADIATANSAIQQNKTDISTANTNIQKNVDDITAVKNSVAINKSTLGIQCKNLLKLPTNNQTINGISYIINDDGTITATGTATKSSNFLLYTLKKDGKYKMSGCPSTGSATTYMITVATTKKDGTVTYSADRGSGVDVTFNSALHTQITISIEIKVGITVEDMVFSPMLRYADITDDTYEPYQANVNTRISALETLSDVVYKNNKSSYCSIDGYILRVGNQVHLNLTATVHTACNAWVGSILALPFKVKTPDGSQRYTIKQTQTDEREISIYISNGSSSFFSSTALQKGDVITIPPMILDMYVEETATTEGGE